MPRYVLPGIPSWDECVISESALRRDAISIPELMSNDIPRFLVY